MKIILQILKGLTVGLPAAIRALIRWFCALFQRKIRPGKGQCNSLNNPVVRVPDPTIYDQYYLMSLGLPISWENPDISIWLGGVPVSPSDLSPGTTYQVLARIWNNSTDAPIAGLPVAFSYLSFGVATVSHPIGQTSVNLGVKGGPDQPAFATINWTTPSVPGHYCVQVTLLPASDTNWNNNLGQENTQVVAAHSPAVTTFDIRNDTKQRQIYRFQVDGYEIGDPTCPPPPGDNQDNAAPVVNPLPARLAYLSMQPAMQATPLPPGWTVTFRPANPELTPSAETTVQITIEPPSGFTGNQTVNVHAFRTPVDRRDANATLAGGMTFSVTSS
jgi:hypothetical protein